MGSILIELCVLSLIKIRSAEFSRLGHNPRKLRASKIKHYMVNTILNT